MGVPKPRHGNLLCQPNWSDQHIYYWKILIKTQVFVQSPSDLAQMIFGSYHPKGTGFVWNPRLKSTMKPPNRMWGHTSATLLYICTHLPNFTTRGCCYKKKHVIVLTLDIFGLKSWYLFAIACSAVLFDLKFPWQLGPVGLLSPPPLLLAAIFIFGFALV